MKTEVVMHRPLFGREIRQKSKSGFLSATDLVKAADTKRAEQGLSNFQLSLWLQQKGTKEFVEEIEKETGTSPVEVRKGRNGGTWMHPLLFIDLALALSPRLKLEAYKWLHDELLKHRNNSGDSYKLMTGALYDRCSDKFRFPRFISSVARRIKDTCNVDDWQKATQEQLRQRDKIHNDIALLCSVLHDPEQAVQHALRQHPTFY